MRKIVALILLPLFLCGCSNVNEDLPGRPRIVTGITAVYQKGAMLLQREYTDDAKMRSVLDYLRLLKTYGLANDVADDPSSSTVRITLHFSDETKMEYEQRDDRFLRCNDGAWEHIDPEQGQELALLLGMLQSD